MKKSITYQNTTIYYDLTYKKVKNINLRVRPDGTVTVSARRGIPESVIEAFVLSEAEFILHAISQQKNQPEEPLQQFFSESEIRELVLALCREVYPYYQAKGILYPVIKFRKMVSCWGNCRPAKGVLTFSLNLVYAPKECVEYVVWHEFTHFLEANHGKGFYAELAKVCPDWKERRKALKSIKIPR